MLGFRPDRRSARGLQSHGGQHGGHHDTHPTPSLTIRIRRAADNASRVIHTHTRRLSITSLSFLKMEVMVFKYHAK